MKQSLAIYFSLEGGYPNAYLSIQDNYHSPAQLFMAPLEFTDLPALINSIQQPGEYPIITASPDNPQFQIESAIQVTHDTDNITWELIFEHYEPYLNIELEPFADEFDENIISFTFDPFQYVSALYQASQLSRALQPTTFTPPEAEADDNAPAHPLNVLGEFEPKLQILWQKHGIAAGKVENGKAVEKHDFLASESEKQWLQDIIDTLDAAHEGNVMDNLDSYLDSLPDGAITYLEENGQKLQEVLQQRWEMLVNSLTEEEADALEQQQTTERFPNSLKLRLMREFIDGNPSILLGHSPGRPGQKNKVIDLQSWRKPKNKPTT